MDIQPTTKYLSFTGEFEIEAIRPLLDALDSLRSDTSIDQIQVTLISLGGFFTSAFAVYDCLHNFPKPVDIVVAGSCQSCAVLVLQAARMRYSYANTDFLLHQPGFSVSSTKTLANLKQDISEYERQEKLYWKLLSRRTNMSPEEMRDYCVVDQSFGVEKALELGLIDRVIQKD